MGVKVNGTKKITDLIAVDTINDADVFMIETTSGSRKVTGAALKSLINNTVTVPTVDNTLNVSGAAADSKTVGDILSRIQDDLDNVVTDVRINDISIIDDGVANIPYATSQAYGVVIVGSGLGINANNRITVIPASVNEIKDSSASTNNPIIPARQDASTFYGLAKAAGDVTQSTSNNSVGVYTEEAKAAIREMLGIPNMNGELIADVTTEEDLSTLTISTDISGNNFNLCKTKIEVLMPASLTGTNDYVTARFGCIKQDDTTGVYTLPTLKMLNKNGALFIYEIEAYGAYYCSRGQAASAYNSTGNSMMTLTTNTTCKGIYSFVIKQYSETSTLIPAGTTIKIYGVRN